MKDFPPKVLNYFEKVWAEPPPADFMGGPANCAVAISHTRAVPLTWAVNTRWPSWLKQDGRNGFACPGIPYAGRLIPACGDDAPSVGAPLSGAEHVVMFNRCGRRDWMPRNGPGPDVWVQLTGCIADRAVHGNYPQASQSARSSAAKSSLRSPRVTWTSALRNRFSTAN